MALFENSYFLPNDMNSFEMCWFYEPIASFNFFFMYLAPCLDWIPDCTAKLLYNEEISQKASVKINLLFISL